MRKAYKPFSFASVLLTLALIGGCGTAGGVLSVLPFGAITSVQLFDEPDFTIAFSVDTAVSNPALVTKINWVFGDGGGFVEGPAGRTTITHQYGSTGTFQVTAFIFGAQGFINQVNGSVTVLPGSGGAPPGPTPTTPEAPARISSPSPADNAVDVAIAANLAWSAGSRAASHDVYFGTDRTAVENATRADAANFKGTQTATTFDPGDLTENTSYFWRIDEVNTGGTTKGLVLTFRTARAPAQARNPVPVNGSTSARVNQVLQWVAGNRAVSHDVYFGKVMNDVLNATRESTDLFKGNQTGLTFDPADEDALVNGELLPATTYFWRIDEVGPGGTTAGNVFSFTTRALPPAITNPSPADLATGVTTTPNLTWSGVSAIESYDVYFGTAQLDVENATRTSPEFRGNQANRMFDPGALLPDQNYFWRVDTLGPGGTATGAVMTFSTAQTPGEVQGPFTPANFANGVAVDVNLAWAVGAGGPTESFDVFLGTNQNEVTTGAPAALQANLPVSETVFNPPMNLVANTNYFWRIDSIGPGGRTTGTVRTFRTGVLATQAQDPSPAIGATSVSQTVMLSWMAGMGANGHDVYLGTSQSAVNNATDMDAEFRGHLPLATTTFSPGTLNANTEYFWRIDETAAGGPTRGAVWRFTTGPGKAINPMPAHQATDGSVSLTLSWTAGTGATSHDVYLGTNLTGVTNATRSDASGIFRGNQTGTIFSPTLTASTTFFWRIDEVATVGGVLMITKGDVWQFATSLGKATNPVPANLATGVAPDVILEWTAGAGAASNDVYFGTNLAAVTNATTASPEFQGNQTGTQFDPAGNLAVNTTFFWRIDTVAIVNDVFTRKKGDIWRFTTLAPPAQASAPTPISGTANVALPVSLMWMAGAEAATFDVYFGTSAAAVFSATTASPEFQGNQAAKTFSPLGLTPNTAYFWRIDARNAAGVTTGQVWSFVTAP
jgi:hypothetical protein